MGRFVLVLMQNQFDLHLSHSMPRRVGHPNPPEALDRVQRSNFQGKSKDALRKIVKD